MGSVADLQTARVRASEREAALRDREAADLRALLAETPEVTADRRIWWTFVRAPEPFESLEYGDVVSVAAVADGLGLRIDRKIIRRKSGAPLPVERTALAALLHGGEAEIAGDAPMAKDAPQTGLRLRVELVECSDRMRVVAGQGVRE